MSPIRQTYTREFPPWNHTGRIDGEFSGSVPLADLAERLLQFLPGEFVHTPKPQNFELKNWRGMTKGNGRSEEFLRVQGEFVTGESFLLDTSFQFIVSTSFVRFEGGTLVSKLEARSLGALSSFDSLTPCEITRLIPARISQIDFGIELFRLKSFGGFFGNFPFQVGSLSAKATRSEIRYSLVEERMTSTSLPPLASEPLAQRFQALVAEFK